MCLYRFSGIARSNRHYVTAREKATHEGEFLPDKKTVDELTKEFLAESLEGLDRMEQCLTELEARPEDGELLGEIFRAVHTIKGTTGFLGFGRLEKLAHTGENLLGALREGRLQADSEMINGLLELMDGLRSILRLIETTDSEGARSADDDSALIALLNRLNEAEGHTSGLPAPVAGGSRSDVIHRGSLAPGAPVEKTLRVEVDVLNRMMNLVGELVLTRNQIQQKSSESAKLSELARRLDTVTTDLRETVMRARMQPVGHLFGKFPRMVRDLARGCGKDVRIEFSGQDTGLDRSLMEAIKDPLTHAVRNAVDHGIEKPAQRTLAGKPQQGRLTLRAYHLSRSVVIEVIDDGAGIGRQRVLEKALERKLIQEERAAAMTDAEVLQLVFLPGFSTAEAITNVSGRGVGMDVVRANIEKAGGSVELESTLGEGTVLRLRVPLTLAIVPALVVRSGGQSFCLPQATLAELVYVPSREADASIEHMGSADLYRLRDTLLPMVWLDRLLCLPPAPNKEAEHGFYLAVLEAEGCRFGLAVDHLMAPEEIVVKPLSSVLREIGVFSGATVLGNGMLAIILDVAAIAERAGVRPGVVERLNAKAEPALTPDSKAAAQFLIFDPGGPSDDALAPQERRAIALQRVERIETVALTSVEYVGGRHVMQYRGELMSLEDTAGILDNLRGIDASHATVLICRQPQRIDGGGSKRSGLVVGSVLDVAEGSLMSTLDDPLKQEIALVRNRLTSVHRHAGGESSLREVA